MRRTVILVAATVLAASAMARPGQVRTPPSALPGWSLYDRFCLPCHGTTGNGHGPAAPYSWGRPRDLTAGDFAWRSTPTGASATDDDLRVTITHGAPGTSMHGFGATLSRAQLDELVAVVRAFGPATVKSAAAITLGAAPPADARRGAELWTKLGCASCHAADGTGTPGVAVRPYDLTREVLRRPRPDDDIRRAAAMSIATGRTSMPGYAGAVAERDLWALADHVLVLGARARPPRLGVLDDAAVELDRTIRVPTATWTGDDPAEKALFGAAVPAQGPPPTSLAPAQASLAAEQCGRCHAKQYREWDTSLHRRAASPGLAAQMMGMADKEARACLRCHAPLAEQQTDPLLKAQSLSCAGCHVRSWKRHGPAPISPSLTPLPGYPLATLAIYDRGDFCLPCHQLTPRSAVDGKPLLDTYKEWLDGPYMKRGIQCQHCHMPNREHSFRGVHDPSMFRGAVAVTGAAHASGADVTVRVEVANIGAGHYVPTNPTPAAWLRIELRDRDDKPIPGASASLRIGRDIYWDGKKWHERSDTRIPPGERVVMARAWTGGRTAEATTARVSLDVHPDDYYERVYETRLAQVLLPPRRALYQEALADAIKARYTAVQQTYPITRR